jgi:hypothetical protein
MGIAPVLRQYAFSLLFASMTGAMAWPTLAGADTFEAIDKAINEFELAEEAYIYAFPMIASYNTMYDFAIDKASSQFKAPFNRIWNDSHAFTPKDNAVALPNPDAPSSLVWMDLRAEPVVLCVPAIESKRYYSVQLVDLYTYNFGYIGTRTMGNDAGCYMVSGPGWTGDKPSGIAKVFPSDTQFAIGMFHTQLFAPNDIDNVRHIQAAYKVQTLSGFLGRAPPAAPPALDFPKFTMNAFKGHFIAYLNFLLRFCPTVPDEVSLREQLATIGIGPGKSFSPENLSLTNRLSLMLDIKLGYDKIKDKEAKLGRSENGWRVAEVYGDRAFYHGDWLLRAAAVLVGIYGNDANEALFPIATVDRQGNALNGHTNVYTLTFPGDALPPANAFWSLTMYDAKNKLLVANPINRYLINSAMLPGLKKAADGSLTIYIQRDSPGAAKEPNWLPAPDGNFYLVMRLYLPKPTAIRGQWQQPPVVVSQ